MLGLKEGAKHVDIKKAVKRLAFQFHPDRHPDLTPERKTELERTMSEITEAARFLSGTGGDVKQPDNSDFMSALRNLHPDGPEGPRQRVKSVQDMEREKAAEKEAEKKFDRKQRENVAEERRWLAEENRRQNEERKMLEKELASAEGDVKHFLGLFHVFRKNGYVCKSDDGYIKNARAIVALEEDPFKKEVAMSTVPRMLRNRLPEDVITTVIRLCEAGKADEPKRFRNIVDAAIEFYMYSVDDLVEAYRIISQLKDKTIEGMKKFSKFLEGLGISVNTAKSLARVLNTTLAHTDDLEAVSGKTSIKEYIDKGDPVGSYVGIIPLLLSSRDGDKAFSAANKLSSLSNLPNCKPQQMQVFRKITGRPQDVGDICSLIGDIYCMMPFRNASPMESYNSIERIYDNVMKKDVPQKWVVKLINMLGKYAKHARPADMAEEAINFFDLARGNSIKPETAVLKFKSFFTEKAVSDGAPGWSDEMRTTFRELKAEMYGEKGKKGEFRKNVGTIFRGFFAAYPQLPEPVQKQLPAQRDPTEDTVFKILRKYAKFVNSSEVTATASLFFELVAANAVDPVSAAQKFRSFMSEKSVADKEAKKGPYWTAEMRGALRDLKNELYRKKDDGFFSKRMEIILRGFFSVYLQLSYPSDPSASPASPSQ